MPLQLGAHVRTSDGQDLGTIDKLIVDPASGDVRAAVVRKGFILSQDVEVPVDAFEATEGDPARITYSSEQVDELPRFHEGEYTTPPVEVAPSNTFFDYPRYGLLWPARFPAGYYPIPRANPPAGELDREVDQMLRQKDLENAVVDEGSDVRTRDGEKVGEIHRLSFDPESGGLTSFVVRKGFLLTEDLELPGRTIDSVDDGVVYLKLTKQEVEEQFSRTGR